MKNKSTKLIRAIIVILCVFLIEVICIAVSIFFGNKVDTEGFSGNINRNLLQGVETRLSYDGKHLYKSNVNILTFEARKSLDNSFVFDLYNTSPRRMKGEVVNDEYVLYFQNTGYTRALYIKYRDISETNLISSDVGDSLQISGQNIYYIKRGEYNSDNSNNDELWVYNSNTKENLCLHKGVVAFCISEDSLYTVSCNTDGHEITVLEHINILRKYSLITNELMFEKQMSLDIVVTEIMANNRYIALWTNRQRLYLYDIREDIQENVIDAERFVMSGQSTMSINFSNKYMYASISFSNLTKMDSLSGVKTTDYGTWKYDLEAEEWQQISKDVYDALYVFDENYVFGVNGKTVYQIYVEADKSEIKKLK